MTNHMAHKGHTYLLLIAVIALCAMGRLDTQATAIICSTVVSLAHR